MDVDLKAKWIEALRSDEYEQARSTLYDGEGYCCLGVLCEVAGLEKSRKEGDGAWYYKFKDDILEDESIPREQRADWGLSDDDQSELIDMNDTRGLGFDYIADWIEEKL